MMSSDAVRCTSCGHDLDSVSVRLQYGGACPHCLGAFALEGLVAPPAPTPVPSGGEFGKFVLTDRLGKGGMGEVWKAFDKELNRWVALKFLRGESPQELARFQREARTAAALSHPGIAAIYEVGETNGRHFIAMQYVEGRTLQMHPRKDRKGLARLIRDAARALEHAHRQGVIHRDLKPENLIVEKTETETRVLILDFGLAKRIQGGESLSKSGTVAGTLAYMSPEQARGEKLDERTDVYSLGATLYEVLTGKPPFEGANAYEIMRRIEDQEPTTPRRLNQHIPHDLETITLKCLEKDRERRYGSAKDLADDLDRFLEGDAVMARRASTWYRVKMRLSKRKAVIATAGVAALVLSAVLGWWALVASPDTRHARLMFEAGKLWALAKGEAMHGVNPEAISKKARLAREAFERALAEGERHDALLFRGLCLQLEGKSEESLRDLTRAHELKPEDEEVKLHLASHLLFMHRFSMGTPEFLEVLATGKNPAGYEKDYALPPVTRAREVDRMPVETADLKKWRTDAEHLLKHLKVDPPFRDLLRGLQEMGRGRFGEAALALAGYTKEEMWDLKVLRLEALCRRNSGDLTGAIRLFDSEISRVPTAVGYQLRGNIKRHLHRNVEAIADYSSAIELESSRAESFAERGATKGHLGQYDSALSDHDRAISLAPRKGWAYRKRGDTHMLSGNVDKAIADYTRAIDLDPNNAWSRHQRSNAYYFQGRLAESDKDLSAAINLAPDVSLFYLNRACSRTLAGDHEGAAADLQRAEELRPNSSQVYSVRGILELRKGRFDMAEVFLTRAIELDPKSADAYFNRACLFSDKGSVDAAISDFTRTIELDPSHVWAYGNRGAHLCNDKNEHDAAIRDFSKAIELAPKAAVLFRNRGAARSASGDHTGAIVDLTKAIELSPKDASHSLAIGDAYRRAGSFLEADGAYTAAINKDNSLARAHLNRGSLRTDVFRRYDDAIRDFDAVLRLDPSNAKAHFNRGLAHQWKRDFEKAVADYSKAIELAPGDLPPRMERGTIYYHLRRLELAIADYSKVIEISPRHADAHHHRAHCRYALGDRAGALEDCRKALEMAPLNWKSREEVERHIVDYSRVDSPELSRARKAYATAEDLFSARKFREAIPLFKEAMNQQHNLELTMLSAYNVACCHALLGEKDEALRWLEVAVEKGWKNADHLERDDDLDSLRGEERYKKLVAKLKGE